MTFNQQANLLLIGAGIALASSLLTAVVTSLVDYFLGRRARIEANKERLQQLVGKTLGIAYGPEDNMGLSQLEEMAEAMSDIPNQDVAMLNVMIGAGEAWVQEITKMKELLRQKQQEEEA